MYKFQSKQIQINDFGMPLGMKLNPENRWVKKAEMMHTKGTCKTDNRIVSLGQPWIRPDSTWEGKCEVRVWIKG
jgi:hypothetical protein